ncbi:hypothetical protein [Streptomyces fradiae]|uniref:hypothetical protein n=1 Tax=Streptomyces fradiae TaxID=1906 RepID=UPI0036FC4C27
MRNAMTSEEYDQQAQRGEPEKDRWSKSEQLLASLYDAVRDLQYITIMANHSGKGRKPRRPTPLPRPGVTPSKGREPMSDRAASTLFQLINGGAA